MEPEKTTIFPESCDIAGWVRKKGGFLEASPHRRSSLQNARQENITKVKHLRSFVGLYKTLHMATPATSRILAPLEDAVAGKESADPIDWTHSLSQRFREAKAHIKNTHTLYLPHPDDQLVIKTDAAQSSPGIGHTIYAIKEGKLHPVRFH